MADICDRPDRCPLPSAAIASSLRSIGDLTTAEKINDARWQRPDMRMIRNGLAANGLATIAAGCLGTVALGTTSGSVGASVATGVTSRVVGLATGALFIVFAFVPTISDLLMVIPRPVIGASLVFSSCFINVGGHAGDDQPADGRKTCPCPRRRAVPGHQPLPVSRLLCRRARSARSRP